MNHEDQGFEMATGPAVVTPSPRRGSYALQMSEPGVDRCSVGPWEIETEHCENGWLHAVVRYRGKDIIEVDGPRGTVVKLLRDAIEDDGNSG